MNVLKRIKRVFIPVDQPTDFPRLYFIPNTQEVTAPRRSANEGCYRSPVVPRPIKQSIPTPKVKRKNFIQRFIQRQKEKLHLACEKAWSATKSFGRSVVRWLAWRVFMPLSVIASLWVPSIFSMDLPL